MAIDKRSRIPAYVQLMDTIKDYITNERLAEGDKLPSERELCEIYDISRATVRQAIHELEIEGYVYIKKGIGSFVMDRRFNQEMSGLYSYTEYMKGLGKTISTKLIDFTQMKCNERLAEKMKCETGADIYRFTRVRYADNEPMLVVTTHLPCRRFPDLDEKRLIDGSLYSLLKDEYHVSFTTAYETLQSVSAKDNEAVLLSINKKAPCMKIDRFTFENGTLIEYAVGIARGDKFKYNIQLQ
jgi:GntR family transcriptional regulator